MVQQEGRPDSGEAGGPAQSLPLPDLLLQSKGREFTAEAKGHRGSGVVSSFEGNLNFSALAPPSIRPPVQPSVLALALLRHEIEAAQLEDMLEIACHIQRHLKVSTHVTQPPTHNTEVSFASLRANPWESA